jgi:hypothetical protein
MGGFRGLPPQFDSDAVGEAQLIGRVKKELGNMTDAQLRTAVGLACLAAVNLYEDGHTERALAFLRLACQCRRQLDLSRPLRL